MPHKYYIVGVFDCLHHGHISFLRRCIGMATQNDGQLFVGVHTDAFVASYKRQPIQHENVRLQQVRDAVAAAVAAAVRDAAVAAAVRDAAVAAAVRDAAVAAAVFLVGGDHEPVFAQYGITHIIHGDDWTADAYERQIGCAALQKHGVECVYVPYTRNVSTTELIRATCPRAGDVFLVDIDGTVLQTTDAGTSMITGARDVLDALQTRGVHVVFFTNNTICHKHTLAKHLARDGEAVRIWTPIDDFVAYIHDTHVHWSVYVFGNKTCKDTLRKESHTNRKDTCGTFDVTDDIATANMIFVAYHNEYTYDELKDLCIQLQLRRDLPYVISNIDAHYPYYVDGAKLNLPDTQYLYHTIRNTVGRDALHICGKPHTDIARVIRGINSDSTPTVYVIGDRIDTDMRLVGDTKTHAAYGFYVGAFTDALCNVPRVFGVSMTVIRDLLSRAYI